MKWYEGRRGARLLWLYNKLAFFERNQKFGQMANLIPVLNEDYAFE
jgi:hypothetical protein